MARHAIPSRLVRHFAVVVIAVAVFATRDRTWAANDGRDPHADAAATVGAQTGKQACSLGVIGRGLDRLSVGIGMIPRGEVGLIFAAIGQGLVSAGNPVIDAAVYSAIVVMVMATTLVTPPLLSWSLRRQRPPVSFESVNVN